MNIIRSLRLRISDLWQVCLREFRHIFADSGAILFFLVVPFAYPFLYSALYGSEVVREAPLVVIDKSHTAHSREFIRRVDASPDVRVVAHVAGESEAYRLIGEERAYGILIIPEDFDRMLMSGRRFRSTWNGKIYQKTNFAHLYKWFSDSELLSSSYRSILSKYTFVVTHCRSACRVCGYF